MIEDIEIFHNKTEYVMRGQASGAHLFSSPDAGLVIQRAIDSFNGEGGEVLLHRGIYELNAPIQLDSRCVLRGKGVATCLKLTPANEQGIGILCEDKDYASVCNLSLRPAARGTGVAGIVLHSSGCCQIREVRCKGFASYGIWMRENSFLCEISRCQLADNQKSNLFMQNLRDGGRGGDFLPGLVSGLTIYGGGNGIECEHALVLNITSCLILHPGKIGIHIHSESNSVLVSGCRTLQVEMDCVVVQDSHEINLSSNIFCWHRDHGIILDNVKWGTVSANNIIDTGVRAHDKTLRNGIILRNGTSSVQVTGNALFNWGDQMPMQTGIDEDASCRVNLMANNNVNYYTEQDVISRGAQSLAQGNVGIGPEAWLGMDRDPYPDFSLDGLNTFLENNFER
ncbi:right-handed parallel beta-helix repeat-containing protein [Pontiella sulfatireligans]|uniref:Right handed beta helix domain-containing protein n=1 Tax=Pontiella sulfatireligans TaxID=2750658 RepID=A0A6C2UHC5_9BACT|nr:right-handed parallel beta-helix repeat-containing protein [Pontiella sulfatireligans]VGO19595.1 hypothetical protein SCARR_01654 [Pontiella sulfatireligans]